MQFSPFVNGATDVQARAHTHTNTFYTLALQNEEKSAFKCINILEHDIEKLYVNKYESSPETERLRQCPVGRRRLGVNPTDAFQLNLSACPTLYLFYQEVTPSASAAPHERTTSPGRWPAKRSLCRGGSSELDVSPSRSVGSRGRERPAASSQSQSEPTALHNVLFFSDLSTKGDSVCSRSAAAYKILFEM